MKGICFKEPLFNATVEGIKTQTRRIIKINDCSEEHKKFHGADWANEPMIIKELSYNYFIPDKWDGSYGCPYCGNGDGKLKPRYKVGEVLYLKEPYNDTQSEYRVLYKFDNDVKGDSKGFWKNKLFMPEEAARYFIKITGVRVERLQDISDGDCIEEGIIEERPEFYNLPKEYGVPAYGVPVMITENSVFATTWYNTPQEAYAALIDKINGKGTWDSNPWVWVYDYILTDKL